MGSARHLVIKGVRGFGDKYLIPELGQGRYKYSGTRRCLRNGGDIAKGVGAILAGLSLGSLDGLVSK